MSLQTPPAESRPFRLRRLAALRCDGENGLGVFLSLLSAKPSLDSDISKQPPPPEMARRRRENRDPEQPAMRVGTLTSPSKSLPTVHEGSRSSREQVKVGPCRGGD